MREETKKLGEQIGRMKGIERQNDQTQGIEKCENSNELQKLAKRKRQLLEARSFEGFQAITKGDWKMKVFQKLQVLSGNVWEAPIDCDIILPCQQTIESNYTAVNSAKSKFGGIDGLRKQNKKEGEVAAMLHTLGFPDNDGNINQLTR